MSTMDLLAEIRADLKRGLREEVLAELRPLIEQRLQNNVFDLAEAATYLKISVSTIRRMIAGREIPFFLQRGQYFFRQVDLDRWIDSKVKSNLKRGGTGATAENR